MISCLKMDLALNNLRMLICHKTQTSNQPITYQMTKESPLLIFNLFFQNLILKMRWRFYVEKEEMGLLFGVG